MSENISPTPLRRKIRERSLALLIVGAGLLMPPLAGISLIDEKIAGLPITLIYIFLVWALLIAGAAFLAGRLLDSNQSALTSDRQPTED